jgi:20S proteasome subunit beta 2
MHALRRAIKSGIYNDLGSGSNVDLCVITKDGSEYMRNHEYLMDKTYHRKFPVVYEKGTAREFFGGGGCCLTLFHRHAY